MNGSVIVSVLVVVVFQIANTLLEGDCYLRPIGCATTAVVLQYVLHSSEIPLLLLHCWV